MTFQAWYWLGMWAGMFLIATFALYGWRKANKLAREVLNSLRAALDQNMAMLDALMDIARDEERASQRAQQALRAVSKLNRDRPV